MRRERSPYLPSQTWTYLLWDRHQYSAHSHDCLAWIIHEAMDTKQRPECLAWVATRQAQPNLIGQLEHLSAALEQAEALQSVYFD